MQIHLITTQEIGQILKKQREVVNTDVIINLGNSNL